MHVHGKQRECSLYFGEHQHTCGPERRVNRRPASSLSPIGHLLWRSRHRSALHVSTFLRSLRSTPITELPCYCGRSDSCPPGSSGPPSMNSGSFSEQVSLIHASGLPDHSVSNHLVTYCRRFCTLPLSATIFRFRSRLRPWCAGSPISPGRIEFVSLRTGRSPPAAPHHASLRRSCIRLQAGERLPEEDLHLSDCPRSQAHTPPALAAWCFNFYLVINLGLIPQTPPALAAWCFNFDLKY